MQDNINKLKYHSTNQFRQVVKNITTKAKYKGQDEDNKPIIDELAVPPKLEFFGTVKLHGTNGNIVVQQDGTITFHSKKQILGVVSPDGEYTHKNDNAEFSMSMYHRLGSVKKLIQNIKQLYTGEVSGVIKISGEWCGKGIQSGVGISKLDKKSFFIFGIKVGENWLPHHFWKDLVCDNEDGIYNIHQFETFETVIDFSNPSYSQNILVDITNKVEAECPVAKQLGVDGEIIGEGVVWTPSDPLLISDTGNWFKVKGEKHSVSKVKTLAEVDPIKLQSCKDFVDYSVTSNRLEQGLSEVGLDQKLIGKFIGWVNTDIHKEENDVLEANNLTMKDVGKYISTVAREFYINKLREF